MPNRKVYLIQAFKFILFKRAFQIISLEHDQFIWRQSDLGRAHEWNVSGSPVGPEGPWRLPSLPIISSGVKAVSPNKFSSEQ